MPRRNYALENYCDCLAAIRMIREAVETLGPPGVLPSRGSGPASSMVLSLCTKRRPLWMRSEKCLPPNSKHRARSSMDRAAGGCRFEPCRARH